MEAYQTNLTAESTTAVTAKSLNPMKKTDSPHYRSIMSLPIENKGKFREHYKVGHIIARSTIGAVRKCLHVSSKQIRLVEFISKRIVNDNSKAKFNYMDALDKICELEHPNIACSYEIFQDSRRYYIVIE